jgi:hypothetical protein
VLITCSGDDDDDDDDDDSLPDLGSLRTALSFLPYSLTSVSPSSYTVTKVGVSLLPSLFRFRGVVSSGYGRGGKSLGVPTANLRSTDFTTALESVGTGVYVGWGLIELDGVGVDGAHTTGANNTRRTLTRGRGIQHGVVVNVGYSPSFSDRNSEKMIEAHFLGNGEGEGEGEGKGKGKLSAFESVGTDTDFYNSSIRLVLLGKMREETKFGCIDELKEQIGIDVRTARDCLVEQPYAAGRSDQFLVEYTKNKTATKPWIGKGGGDGNASWEEEDMRDAVKRWPLGRFLL